MIVVAAILISVFCVIIKRGKTEKNTTMQTDNKEVSNLLNKDFETNYPKTPREVLKIYSRLSQCIYNENLKEEELRTVVEKMRQLFDKELLDHNTLEQHIEDLKKELKEYKKDKKTITNYMVENNSAVEYKTVNKVQYATIVATYLLNENEGYVKTYEKFILRQDENEKWKIVGWKLTDPVTIEEE